MSGGFRYAGRADAGFGAQGGAVQVQLPTAGDVLSTVSAAGRFVVRRHPVKLGTYVLGLAVALLFTGLAVPAADRLAYEEALPEAKDLNALSRAESEMAMAYSTYYASKGWFSCDARCTLHYDKYVAAKARADAAGAKVEARSRAAHGILGVFSTDAVARARALFHGVFLRGVSVAQRQTLFDAFFVGMRALGRDENIASYALNMVLVFLSNFASSMFVSLFVFAWRVREVVAAFNGGWLLGTAFWAVAVLAAGSVLLTVVLGAVLGVGGAVAGVALAAAATGGGRLGDGGAGGGRPRVVTGGRVHYQ